MMNTKTTLAIIASLAVLAAAITPGFLTQADAKITPATPPSCENRGGQQPGGQQPNCQGEGLEQNPGSPGTPATNPSGHAPPGQN
jgi:hypothetical protein